MRSSTGLRLAALAAALLVLAAAAPVVPATEQVGAVVVMRSWPPTGQWVTRLGWTKSEGPFCVTSSATSGQMFNIGLWTADQPSGSLNLDISSARDNTAPPNSIKVWVDGFLLGKYPVTRRFLSSTIETFHAAVPRSQARTMLSLFGAGEWVAYSAGSKTSSVPLKSAGFSLPALLDCSHELGALNSLGATADPEQVDRWNWVEGCSRAVALTGKLNAAGICPEIWDKRASLARFPALETAFRAIKVVMARLSHVDVTMPGLSMTPGMIVTPGMITTPGLPAPTPAPIPPALSGTQHAKPSTAPPTAAFPPRPVAGLATNPPPTYPPDARARGEQGRVIVRVVVGADGLPQTVGLAVSSGYPLLDRAALRAVRRWRFVPAERDGKPVAAVIDVPIAFHLSR